MIRYRTKDGDMLDLICQRHYGRTADVVETVLDANPGLAAFGPVLSAGLVIVLPEISEPHAIEEGVTLWD
ncbi:phage tail protein X [Desulfobaculum xiamenense]|uniref:Phage tail protein X n=1 Tax=Desulfobaculum xiamenense TaxID=995050 RepID=A0A846QG38_9BACT|nr:tail protein X [Desulfobaculum xiamenense]NJB67201.1 phage tail protein X [Desulfobaculum xiamenense]